MSNESDSDLEEISSTRPLISKVSEQDLDNTLVQADRAEVERIPDNSESDKKLIGTTLDNQYKILDVLGRGGMSVVYKAMYIMLNRPVAIKTLHAHLASDQQALLRFKQEAQAASQLDHPNVIKIYGFGITSGESVQPYIVMDYIQGIALSDLIKKQGCIEIKSCLRIFIQCCSALAQAHSKGVIHRDLKPSNIMLVQSDDDPLYVKIVDFGIAKILPQEGETSHQLTQTGDVFGSPTYMSPEQCMGQKVDHRSDIYAFACVMYEALTGKPPHQGTNVFETFRRHINEIPEPLKIPGAEKGISERLEAIVFKALEKEPEKRYQTMNSLLADLQNAEKDFESGKLESSIFLQIEKHQRSLQRMMRTMPKKIVVAISFAIILISSAGLTWSQIAWFYEPHNFTISESNWLNSLIVPKPVVSKLDEKTKLQKLDQGTIPLEVAKLSGGDESPELVKLWQERAEYCHSLGETSLELDAYTRAINGMESLQNGNSVPCAKLRELQAVCFLQLGRYADAANALEKALDARDTINQDIPSIPTRLGLAYLRIRAYDKAEKKFNTALGILSSDAPDPLKAAVCLAGIAESYRLRANWAKANDYFIQAVKVLNDKKAKRIREPLTLYSAFVNQMLGNYEKAAEQYAESQEYAEKIFLGNLSDRQNFLNDYAYSLWKSGQFIQAIQFRNKSMSLK